MSSSTFFSNSATAVVRTAHCAKEASVSIQDSVEVPLSRLWRFICPRLGISPRAGVLSRRRFAQAMDRRKRASWSPTAISERGRRRGCGSRVNADLLWQRRGPDFRVTYAGLGRGAAVAKSQHHTMQICWERGDEWRRDQRCGQRITVHLEQQPGEQHGINRRWRRACIQRRRGELSCHTSSNAIHQRCLTIKNVALRACRCLAPS